MADQISAGSPLLSGRLTFAFFETSKDTIFVYPLLAANNNAVSPLEFSFKLRKKNRVLHCSVWTRFYFQLPCLPWLHFRVKSSINLRFLEWFSHGFSWEMNESKIKCYYEIHSQSGYSKKKIKTLWSHEEKLVAPNTTLKFQVYEQRNIVRYKQHQANAELPVYKV